MIRFGEYLPDLPVLGNPGATVANNVIPFGGTYLPLKAISAVSDAMNQRVKGALAVRHTDATGYTYAGTTSKLYEITGTGGAVTDRSGAVYTTAVDEFWEMIKWGNKVIASNFTDVPQIVTIAAGANFAALGGSPHKWRHMAVVKEFIITGNVDEAGTLTPNKLIWSGVNDETAWTATAANLGGNQTLQSSAKYGGGWIMNIKGGEFGVIFQEFTIWRMSFIGSPYTFEFDEILPGHGTSAKNSPVQVGNSIYFLDQDGFAVLTDGSQIRNIGHNKVNRTFISDVDSQYLNNVIGAVDPTLTVVYWIYPGSGSASGVPNKIIAYNYASDRWATAEIDCEYIISGLGQGYTLEQLDTISASLDSLPASLDSRQWTEGATQLTGFNTDHKMGTFTGTTLTASLETAEFTIADMVAEELLAKFAGRRAFVNGIRPLLHGGTATVALKTRNLQSDSVTTGSTISQNTETGICHPRTDARYFRALVQNTGDFNFAVGVDITDIKPSGGR